jgi:hypothetical protein
MEKKKNFGAIKLLKEKLVEEPITETIKAKFEDTNIQIPMVVADLFDETRDARVLILFLQS